MIKHKKLSSLRTLATVVTEIALLRLLLGTTWSQEPRQILILAKETIEDLPGNKSYFFLQVKDQAPIYIFGQWHP